LLLCDNDRVLSRYTLKTAMNGVPAPHAFRSALLALLACALALVVAPGMAAAGTDPSNAARAKPSSFAPRHTTRRAFGAPIQSQILHKGHPQGKPPAKGTGGPPASRKPSAPRPKGRGETSK
jgi:hypothetical protein